MPDQLQELLARNARFAEAGGQPAAVQGALPVGTGPASSPEFGAPGQAQQPISVEDAKKLSLLEVLGLGGGGAEGGGFLQSLFGGK